VKQDLRRVLTAPPTRVDRRAAAERLAARQRRAVLLVFLAVVGVLFVIAMLRVTGVLGGSSHAGIRGTRTSQASANSGPTSGKPAAVVHHFRLTVVTHPDGATVRVIAADGVTLDKGKTPITRTMAEASLTVTVALRGYNTQTQPVALNERRVLDLWLDPAGLLEHKLGEFKSGSAPKQVAFNPDGTQLWVTDLGGNGVEVFDVATMERLDLIKLGQHGGVEVIFTKDGSTAFVSQMETASVFEIVTATHKVRRQMFTQSAWSKFMVLSPDESKLYVANWSGDNVTELDLATGNVLRQIPTVDTPRGLYITPDGKRLFVAGYGAGELQRIYLQSGRSKVLLHTGGAIRHLVADPATGLLYADDMLRDDIYVLDLATEKVRLLAHTDHEPNTIDLTPDGKVLYVSNRGLNNPTSYYIPGPEWGTVLAIDTATGRPLDAIVGGNQTTGLDVSPDGRLLAFSDFLDNRLSLFAIPTYQTLADGHGGRYRQHLTELKK
jgi:YVTN family beta-propeller protein